MRLVPLLCLAAACGGGATSLPAPGPAAAPTAAPAPVVLPPPTAVRVNGTVLAYRLFGDSGRTPVVFIHGSLADLTDWSAQVPSFAQAYRVLTYSRRYHRPNPPVEDDQTYSPALHADDLAALLLALEFPPAHIVGSSYGAYTALVLAQEHPELVRSVVLGEPEILPLLTGTEEGDAIRRSFYANTLDPVRGAFSRGDSVGALRLYYDGVAGTRAFDLLPPETRGRLVGHSFEMRHEMMANREQYLPTVTCRELERLRTPVLLLTAERSTRLFKVITGELGRCLQSDTTVLIPGATHAMHRANPRYYNQVVLRFLVDH